MLREPASPSRRAWGTTGGLEALLYGVRASDLWTFAGAGAALLILTLVAAWAPARRAARVDPSGVLRMD